MSEAQAYTTATLKQLELLGTIARGPNVNDTCTFARCKVGVRACRTFFLTSLSST